MELNPLGSFRGTMVKSCSIDRWTIIVAMWYSNVDAVGSALQRWGQAAALALSVRKRTCPSAGMSPDSISMRINTAAAVRSRMLFEVSTSSRRWIF
jgi:hypothetical protein